jgi:hypothetical protein
VTGDNARAIERLAVMQLVEARLADHGIVYRLFGETKDF